MKIHTKKGSYMMEAALVLPVIIMATVTSVLIIMFFYSQMTERSHLHMALRSEAGRMTGVTVYSDHEARVDNADAELYGDKKAIGGELYGKKYLIMDHAGLLHKKAVFTVEGSCHATDGVSYVRYCNVVKGLADGRTGKDGVDGQGE